MRRFATPALTAVSTALLVVSLAGCAFLPSSQDDNASGRERAASAAPSVSAMPSASRSATGRTPSVVPDENRIDCAVTTDVRLNQPGIEYTLVGDCDAVTIEGQDIEVDAANIDRLTIRGDRAGVDADDIGVAAISGTENEIDATTIGAVEINGDRNEVGVEKTLGSLTISGNDNDVEAAAIIDQAVAGDRNEVTLD